MRKTSFWDFRGERLEKAFLYLLIFMMTLRIVSYLTLFPESVGLTRIVKFGSRFALTGLSMVILSTLKERRPNTKIHWMRLLPFTLYCCYLLMGYASLTWSTNWTFTALQLLMTTESIIFVVVFFQILAFYDALYDYEISVYNLLISQGTLFIGIGFIIGLMVDPETFYRDTHGGAVSRLGGFIINPNELGMLAVLGGAAAFTEILNRQRIRINSFSAIINLLILLLTQSRSSLGAFVLVAGIFILRMDNLRFKLLTVVGGVLVAPIAINTIIIKEGDVSEVMSMTGRLPFWSDLIAYGFPERPLHGYGFMSISQSIYTNRFGSIHSYAGAMTHNTFIQVLINLGLIGAFIVLLQLVYTGYALASTKNKWAQIMAGTMLIPILINSLTEFGIFGESNYGIMFYQFIILFFTLKAVNKPKTDYQLEKI